MVLCTIRKRSGASLPKGARMQVLAEFKISTCTAQEPGNFFHNLLSQQDKLRMVEKGRKVKSNATILTPLLRNVTLLGVHLSLPQPKYNAASETCHKKK